MYCHHASCYEGLCDLIILQFGEVDLGSKEHAYKCDHMSKCYTRESLCEILCVVIVGKHYADKKTTLASDNILLGR